MRQLQKQHHPVALCSAGASSALAVLTNRALFLHATSFLDGLPYFALQLARDHSSTSGSSPFLLPNGLFARTAIEQDDYVMLQRLYRAYDDQRQQLHRIEIDPRLVFDSNTMADAADRGNLKALQWLHDHTNVSCEPRTLLFAATLGNLQVVQWLAANRPDACASLTTKPCDAITFTGDLALVQFLITTFPALQLTTNAMDYAAAQGHLAIVQYLHDHRTEGCTVDAMDHAARCGRLDIVQFLHEHRHEGCSELAMDFAAANGHLQVVQFLHEYRHEGCTANAMDEAAKNGHLEIVQFLHFHRTEGCTTFAMDMAAWHGHLDVLRFLSSHRREGFTPMAIGTAAQRGYLDVVRFLHTNQENEANCHEDAIHEAARYGRVEIVQYLLDHCTKGCLFTARRCADERGFDQVVRLLDQYTRPEIGNCNVRDHELDDTQRRCQNARSKETAHTDRDSPAPAF